MSAAKKTAGAIPHAPSAAVEAEFLAGRDIAVDMLHHAAMLPDGLDQAAALRWYREGKTQDNFAKSFVAQVVGDPTRLDGFSAVLSAVLAEQANTSSGFDADLYRTLPMAEFLRGVPGKDGTRRDEKDWAEAGPAAEPEQSNADARREFARVASLEQEGLLSMLKQHIDGEENHDDHSPARVGMLNRLRQLNGLIYAAVIDEGDHHTLGQLSSVFDGGIA